MSRRPVIVFLVVLAVLVGGSVLFVRSEQAAELLCHQLELRIGEALEGELSIDRCEVRVLAMELAFFGVRIDSSSRGVFGEMESAIVRFRTWQGVSDLSLDRLEVVRPALFLDLSLDRSPQESAAGKGKECGIPSAVTKVATTRLTDGTLTLLMKGGAFLEVRGVDLSAVRHGRRQVVDLSVADGRVSGGAFDEPFFDLEADVEVDQASSWVVFRRASFSSEDLALTFQGSLKDTCDLGIEGSLTADGSLERLADLVSIPSNLLPVTGRMHIAASVTGSIFEPEVSISGQLVEAGLAPIHLGDVELQARFDRESLVFERVSLTTFGGELAVTGRVALEEGLEATIAVSGRDLSVASLVTALRRPGSWVDASFSPSGDLVGTLRPVRLSGDFRAPIEDFVLLRRYTSMGPPAQGEPLLDLPPMRMEGEVSFDRAEIRLQGARLSTGEGALDVDGRFPLRGNASLDVKGRAHRLPLQALSPIVGTDYEGSLSGPVELRGPYGSPRIVADLEVDDFVFSGLKAGNVTGRLRYAEEVLSLENMRGRMARSAYTMERFSLDLGRRGGFLDLRVSLDEVMLEEVIEALVDFIPVAEHFVGVRGRAQGVIGVKGRLGALDISFNAGATDGAIFAQPFRRARVMGRLLGYRLFELDEVVFSLAADDSLTVRGLAEIGGPLSLSLSAREVPTRSLFFAEDLPFSATASGDLVVDGTWDHPRGKGVGLLIESKIHDRSLAPSRLRLSLDGSRLFASGEVIEGIVRGSATIELGGSYAFWTDLQVDEPDLTRWLLDEASEPKWLAEWRTSATGRARFGGLATDISTLEGLVTIETFGASWFPEEGGQPGEPKLNLRTTEPLEVRLLERGLALRRLVLGGQGLRVEATGLRTSEGGLDFAVHADLDLEILERLVPGFSHASGRLGLEASIGGTSDSPILVGSARLSGGQFRLDGFPMTLSELQGPISFSQNRVIVEGLSGVLGSGRLALDGEIALVSFRPDRVYLVAGLEDVRLRIPEEIQSTVTGRLLLSGPFRELSLSGDLEVLRGRFIAELEMDQILPNLLRRVVAAAPTKEREPIMGLDVRVTAPSTIRVDNRTARGLLAADLRIVGTDARPGLLGTVSVAEGSARFRGNEYTVNRGVVEFQDEQRITPWFDVMAEAEIREYRVAVHAYGSPTDPRVFLTSDPPLPEIDLVTLVTLGITSHESDAFGDGLAAAAAADALFAMSGLDRHVRDFIPDNPILRDPSVRITSGYSVRTGQVSPRFAFESTILVDELRLRYSAPIGLPGQKTQAEYRITDIVSAQAEWDTEGRRTTSLGNLGVDLKLRWEMD